MNLKYKVVFGYETERSITIDADELEKAYGVFFAGGRALFREGAVDGKYIQAIIPDYHAIMGWAKGYRLTPEDYTELSEKGVARTTRHYQNQIKESVQMKLQGSSNLQLNEKN